MAFFRVQQVRSTIGLTKKKSQILAALGLHKRMAVRYHRVSNTVAGMLMKVKEIVNVQVEPSPQSPQQLRAARRPSRGYEVLERPPYP